MLIYVIYFFRKAAAMVDAATLEKLEAGFSKLQASDSKSLLKKYLTKEVFDSLKNKKTSFGSTLLDVIQSGAWLHWMHFYFIIAKVRLLLPNIRQPKWNNLKTTK